jgi:hypothetical protein
VKPDRAYELICVVPRATEAEVAEAAQSCLVRLVVLGDMTQDGDLPAELAAHVLGALKLSVQQQSRTVCVGHDDKTDPLAIALRNGAVEAKQCSSITWRWGLIKKSNSEVAHDPRGMQCALFKQADLCLAVGPMPDSPSRVSSS